MLKITNIKKQYKTGDLVQTALDGVSLEFRNNEFVAILGPSGSGKTTLLNIIGGLDKYDKGDLVINGISTKEYSDRDWDTYRNHAIGFVFQSYNLIPHQSILANVELALTISGISRSERRRRAAEALNKVGLGDQLHKRPNQMSGGQMQRVAIARALVNNPDILLADEPTGALDTETGLQVMELLREVACDRLVIMVTHNPELAEQYANRIVKLRDGRLIDDTNPPKEHENEKIAEKPKRKASMSFATSFSLSANNLRTKKARTLLTSFAGSIGIVGIALILALSSGVNAYITDLQQSTMASYPITISEKTVDMNSMINVRDNVFGQSMGVQSEGGIAREGVYSNSEILELSNSMNNSIVENNLTEFKKYLDNPDSEIAQYIGQNGIIYSYSPRFDIYTKNEKGKYINTDRDVLGEEENKNTLFGQMQNNMLSMSAALGMGDSSNINFTELLPDQGGKAVSSIVTDSYDIVYGKWPTAYNELVLVLDNKNSVETSALFQLGFITEEQYKTLTEAIEQKTDIEELQFNYADICDRTFYMVPHSDYYTENSEGNFDYKGNNIAQMTEVIDSSLEVKIVGVVRPREEMSTYIMAPIGYTSALTDYIIRHTDNSAVVKAQESKPDINVLNGISFEEPEDSVKVQKAKEYLKHLGVTDKAAMYMMIMYISGGENSSASDTQTEIPYPSGAGGMSMDAMSQMGAMNSETAMAQLLDMWLMKPDEEILLNIYEEYVSGGSYDDNIKAFGKVSYDAPSSINIYCDSFEAKQKISECVNRYNETVGEDDKITYTDYVALLTDSITQMVDIVSYVLIAFVAVSLVVSCIMIAIITHISVMERTKEIGILRAIGASKRNISQVFNAETFIIGICSGLLGVGISLLLIIPINSVIHSLTDNSNVNAVLKPEYAVVLVIISIIITVIGGFIPAKKAAKKDPVIALRTE